jgi:hypothetical protein
MLIVDKPMPKNCFDCALDCCWVAGTMPFEYAEKRKPNCPIKGELVRCGECQNATYENEHERIGIVWCTIYREWKSKDGFCDEGRTKGATDE